VASRLPLRIEFGAYQVWPHPAYTLLAGRVYNADILLGDMFTLLAWTPWLSEPVNGSRRNEPTITHTISLRVESIEAYRQALDFLSSGMTGTLTLTGFGQELLQSINPSAKNGEWLLIGERDP
jgi:hypothetical protein